MSWSQTAFKLQAKNKGCYLVTNEIVSNVQDIKDYKIGMLNLFMQHTSAGLTLNENYDSDVRTDMKDSLDRIVPEGHDLYIHSAEGFDDMPAHIKSTLIGASVNVPIKNGKLALGTWQGIWYCEFRAMRHSRSIVATIQGEKF